MLTTVCIFTEELTNKLVYTAVTVKWSMVGSVLPAKFVVKFCQVNIRRRNNKSKQT